jgi:hypothetical protein
MAGLEDATFCNYMGHDEDRSRDARRRPSRMRSKIMEVMAKFNYGLEMRTFVGVSGKSYLVSGTTLGTKRVA